MHRCITFLALFAVPGLLGAGAPAPKGIEFFESKIRPVLSKHCYECHSAQTKRPKADLVLDTKAGMLRGGFQLAARFADGAVAGSQAGVLAPGDARSRVIWDTVSHVSYIEHNLSGTGLVGEAGRWKVRWTAPTKTGGVVIFNTAANAANDDDSPLGDFIYSNAFRVASTNH